MKEASPPAPTTHSLDLGRRAFAETCDPTAYVPREDAESALSTIEDWATSSEVGSSVAALIGPPGLGKTMLLRVFESRIRSRAHQRGDWANVLYLPYAGLPPVELIAWIHGLLGRPRRLKPSRAENLPGTHDDESEAGDRIRDPTHDHAGAELSDLFLLTADGDDPFFLLIDDADSMPAETLRAFVAELPKRRSSLRLLLVMNDDAKASRLLAGFDSLSPRLARLQSAMSEDETNRYLAARLRWAGADSDVIAAIDSETKSRFFALSAGNPSAIHRIVGPHFDGQGGEIPGALDTKHRRENWMGRPFDDEGLDSLDGDS